jgi:hypothetical protein
MKACADCVTRISKYIRPPSKGRLSLFTVNSPNRERYKTLTCVITCLKIIHFYVTYWVSQ